MGGPFFCSLLSGSRVSGNLLDALIMLCGWISFAFVDDRWVRQLLEWVSRTTWGQKEEDVGG